MSHFTDLLDQLHQIMASHMQHKETGNDAELMTGAEPRDRSIHMYYKTKFFATLPLVDGKQIYVLHHCTLNYSHICKMPL